MQVTFTTNGNARFALIKTDSADMSVMLSPCVDPALSLRQYADELRAQVARVERRIAVIQGAADMLSTNSRQ